MSSVFRSFFGKSSSTKKQGKIIYTNEPPKENVDQLKIKATISGMVQGVGFRYTTDMLAQEMGVVGTVQNETDGTVFVEAAGSPSLIREFIEQLSYGPSPSAQVDQMTVTFDSSMEDYATFKIVR